ncbi:hypothetical protein BGX34_011699 [Mortierella sp. NVP85]|nr:hypothetical protein BGX34_011699 [Mortierella sp. NVP85]
MSVQTRKLYWITAVVLVLVVFLSFHRNNLPTYNRNQHQSQNGYGDSRSNYDDNDKDYDSGGRGNIYGPGGGGGTEVKPNPTTPKVMVSYEPNMSGKHDTLVIIPSSWSQLQNRQWVRQTIFGIKNNLEPCKKYDGRVIYKFYIHGRASWGKTALHSAEFMQGQVRDLYREFMEYDDSVFTNVTVTDQHALWGDALSWAVETFIPREKITVDKILIFESTTIVNLHRMEESAKASVSPNGFIHIWGEPTPFAGMVSMEVAQQIVNNRGAIKANHMDIDLFTAAELYFTNSGSQFNIQKTLGQMWASDIEALDETLQVVGQVYQFEDWMPIVEKVALQPTPPCATDLQRKKNIAVLTSSFIYIDMCMAEASLPSAENKRIYAAKHGYDFVARAAEFAQEEFRGRKIVWGKIAAILKTLPHYEWLFWMDMDAVVADLDKDLRDIIRVAEENNPDKTQEISLIVAQPVKDKMLNAGVMLIKNTDWSRRFFNEVQTKTEWYRKSSYEQAAIWSVMNEPKWAPGVYLYAKDDHIMNTFPKVYQEGDFIVHFAPDGCPAVPVIEALKKIKKGDSILGVGV